MNYLNKKELLRWRTDNGDYTHNLQYPLNFDSVVIDLGGFKGVWAQQIVDLYNPNIYIIEPVAEFYLHLKNKFSYNNKVKLMNVGVSTENRDSIIYLNSDSSSSHHTIGVPINVKLMTLHNIFEIWKLTSVDLIQINIEGDEYTLLEQLIEDGIINKFKYIQIQFHLGIERCVERRNEIRNKLYKIGFKNRFNYDFVWEGWEMI